MRRIVLVMLIAGWTGALLPAQLRITGLDSLASKAKESVDITLDSNLLQMAGGFLTGNGKDADKIKGVLAGLKAISVKTFEFKEAGQYTTQDLEPIRAQLRTPGWSRIVSVQEKDESSEVYTRTEQGKIVGFAIIAAEARELTVVAIEGSINLNDLAALKALGVPTIRIPGEKGNKE